ncbi:hypothetical protein LIX31_00555 [Leptospira kirschneri]|nr:hypothetical protein [Leptospira kirschneri]WBF96100.1 hypothetical protein LIX31_00555 [Leptospira kirschneri]
MDNGSNFALWNFSTILILKFQYFLIFRKIKIFKEILLNPKLFKIRFFLLRTVLAEKKSLESQSSKGVNYAAGLNP